MSEFVIYIIIFLLAVLVSSISQIILKKSANKKYNNKIREYLNLYVIIAYGMFFSATLITVTAYRRVPLTLGPILECASYIFVPILSYIFLAEQLSKRKLIGITIIITGIFIYMFGA